MKSTFNQLHNNEKLKENLFIGVDCAVRLLQTADLVRRVEKRKPVGLAAAAIVGVDVGDGIIARQWGGDGPKRRVADSVIDSVVITAGLAATYHKRPASRPYVGMLAAREVFVASGWAKDLRETKQVKKGDIYHKLPSLAIAAFCVAANRDNEKLTKATGWAAVGVNAALAVDYYKGWTDPERNVMLDTGVQEVPGFYGPRKAVNRMINNGRLQLVAAKPPALEAPRDFIDGECEEIELGEEAA